MEATDGPRAAPFGFTRIVFLSHVITAGGPTFPGDPPVEIHPAATIERDGYHLQSLVAGEQAGTHWAAPAHFAAGQAAADELDPGDFFYPRPCSTCGPRRRRTRTSPWASPRSRAGRRIRAGPGARRRDHVDGLRGPVGRPAGLPERGRRGPAALSGVRPGGRELADRAALHRRARDLSRWESTRVPTRRSAPTGCCSPSIASTWRTWLAWVRCRRPAAGSSWGGSGYEAARARRPPCSG